VVSYRFDDGREGYWDPDVLLGVLSIIHSNQEQQVHSGTSRIYNELNSAYPSHTWFSSETDRSFMRGYSKPWTITNLVFVPRHATPSNTFQVTDYGRHILSLPQDAAYRTILRDLELDDEDLGTFNPFHLVATALRDINNGQTDWPVDPYPISLDTFRSLLQNIDDYDDWELIQSSNWSETSDNYNPKLYRRMRLIRTIISNHLGLVNLGDDNSIVGINSEVVNQFLDLTDITDSQPATSSTPTITNSGELPPPPLPQAATVIPANVPAWLESDTHSSSGTSNSSNPSGSRRVRPGCLYLRVVMSVDDDGNPIHIYPMFKHGTFTITNENTRSRTGYTDLPPRDSQNHRLVSRFCAVSGLFPDDIYNERVFSNRLVEAGFNIEQGIGGQSEWHRFNGVTNQERYVELLNAIEVLENYSNENEVQFERRNILEQLELHFNEE